MGLIGQNIDELWSPVTNTGGRTFKKGVPAVVSQYRDVRID